MIESGFFPSKGGDRVYSAEQFGKIMDYLITDGVYEVYPANGIMYDSMGQESVAYAPFQVSFNTAQDPYYSPTTPSVTVGPGRAWFDHTWTHVSSPEIVPLLQPPINDFRWDILVLTMNKSEGVRRNYFRIISGTEGLDAPDTTLLQGHYMHEDRIHDVPIAFIKMKPNVTTPTVIRSAVGYALCPFVRSINGSRNNVWSVQHIYDAATAQISERIGNMGEEVNEWLANKDIYVDEYLANIKGGLRNELVLEIDDRYNKLDAGLNNRIQQEITNRLSGIDQEIADRVDRIVNEKLSDLDIKGIVTDALTEEVLSRFDTMEQKIDNAKLEAVKDAHPVGSLYLSTNGDNPNLVFPGTTWRQISGRYLFASGNGVGVDTNGGRASFSLTANHLPSHTHSISPSSHSHTLTISSHYHAMNHAHGMDHVHVLSGSEKGSVIAVGDNVEGQVYMSTGLTAGGGWWQANGAANKGPTNSSPWTTSPRNPNTGSLSKTQTDTYSGNTGSTSASGTCTSTTLSIGSTGYSTSAMPSIDLNPQYYACAVWRRTV